MDEVEDVARAVQEPTTLHRMAAAMFGAFITSGFVTPLEVVKTRLQAPKSTGRTVPGGTLAAMAHIVRNEGLVTLWSGLRPTLLMSIPSTAIYFSAYDELKRRLEEGRPEGHWVRDFAPLVAGGAARVVAATITSPLELARTKMQASKSNMTTIESLVWEIRVNGVLDLWRGLGPTLLRDVPFSMMYWFGYDRLQRSSAVNAAASSCVNREDSPLRHRLIVSFLSGSASGSIAAFVTHPFDVVKTRQQAHTKSILPCCDMPKNTFPAMRAIVKCEGVSALYAGLVARLAKVAPACAIMISSYELGKLMFTQ